MRHAGSRVFVALVALSLGCGTEAPAVPEPALPPEPTPADPPTVEPGPGTGPSEGAPEAIERASPAAVVSAQVRAAFDALLPSLEVETPGPAPGDCAMGCVVQDDASLVAVTPLAIEGDGSPTSFEVRVVGREPLVRTVTVEGDPEEWERYELGEGPAPWLRALTRATPTLPASRPARDLIVSRSPTTFGLSEYASLVALGGELEGRLLFWYESRYAQHLFLVHGAEHQMRRVASLPIQATACDGSFETMACVRPVGIDAVFAVPGTPALLVRLFHPEPGHGLDGYSTLLVPIDDDSALHAGPEVELAEIEASLAAPGARVRSFAVSLREGAPCDGGCVYFREDRTFAWAFPELLVNGSADRYSVRRRDGTLATPLLPAASAAQVVEEELGEATGTLARDIIARCAVAAWSGFSYSPVVELGPPHMGRRLTFETSGDAEVLYWLHEGARVEVGRVARRASDAAGPFGIDRVLAPEGAGYPLVVVAVAPLPRTRAAPDGRHRIELVTIMRAPTLAPSEPPTAPPSGSPTAPPNGPPSEAPSGS